MFSPQSLQVTERVQETQNPAPPNEESITCECLVECREVSFSAAC